MKFRRQLAALVAVAMMIGCMPGFVLATETDESQTPTEQTTEVQEEEPAETVEEEDEDPVEETVELIEDSDEYSVNPAYASTSVSVTYLMRGWNPNLRTVTEEIRTIAIPSDHVGIPEDTTNLSGYYYIDKNQTVDNRISVKNNSTLTLILADGVTLECRNGIEVPYIDEYNQSYLEIQTQSDDSGTLIARATDGCAGIGGSAGNDAGYIYIGGGTINATGVYNGAGIGGGQGHGVVRIEIFGGNVTATGNNAADLGSNYGNGLVSIHGGNITLPKTYYPHTSRNIDLDNMCVSDSDGIYYQVSEQGILYDGGHYLEFVISPCQHSSGVCDPIEGDDDHHTFTCDYCGYTEVDLHIFENGTCICGAESSELPAPQFVGHSMEISGEISLQFFYTLPEGATDSYVTFEGNRIDTSIAHVPTPSTKPGYSCNMVQLNVSSIQIADSYTPTLHYILNDEPQELEGAPYSVMDYINWAVVDGNAVVSPEEKTMLNKLADYGYYSQIYTASVNGWTYGETYTSVDLGRDPLAQNWNDIMTRTAEYAITSQISSDMFDAVTFSMRFGDTLSLRVIFDPAEGATINKNDFDVVCNYSADQISRTRLSDGRYAVTVTGISARDLDQIIEITYQTQDNHVVVRPLSYIYAMLKQGTNNYGMYLVGALYYYAEASRVEYPQ